MYIYIYLMYYMYIIHIYMSVSYIMYNIYVYTHVVRLCKIRMFSMSSVHVTLAVRPISTAWVEEEEPLFARHLGDPAPGESDP